MTLFTLYTRLATFSLVSCVVIWLAIQFRVTLPSASVTLGWVRAMCVGLMVILL